jgi:hypothetical protein
MKRFLVSVACAAIIACGSSGTANSVATADQVGAVEPDTELVQLIGPEQLNWESGTIEMKYALRVTNHATEEITLRQIQIQTVGQEGPYTVPQSSYFFRTAISAGDTRSIEFFAKAQSEGNRYRIDAESPVSVRVIAYFEAPKGNFRKTFITNLGQSFNDNNH